MTDSIEVHRLGALLRYFCGESGDDSAPEELERKTKTICEKQMDRTTGRDDWGTAKGLRVFWKRIVSSIEFLSVLQNGTDRF